MFSVETVTVHNNGKNEMPRGGLECRRRRQSRSFKESSRKMQVRTLLKASTEDSIQFGAFNAPKMIN